MLFDAIVLAGGRSSRLDAVPKAELVVDGRTLLRHTLEAVTDARRIVVVGPAPRLPLPEGVGLVRESPEFGGPAAGIAAGLAALRARAAASGDTASAHTVVVACDMPAIASALPALLAAAQDSLDGAIALDTDRRQPLAAVYATTPLTDAVAGHERAGTLTGLGVFRLTAGLALTPVAVPPGSTDDVDTWADATRLGAQQVTPKRSRQEKEETP